MGIGYVKSSVGGAPAELSLVMSWRYNETAKAVKDRWHWAFRHASQLLSDSTDGHLIIKTVYIANNEFASHEADFYLLGCSPLDGVADCAEYVAVAKSCLSDFRTTLFRTRNIEPFTLVHELAHYFFDLGDEYEAEGGCTKNADSGACIMEFSVNEGVLMAPGMTNGSLLGGGSNAKVFQFCTSGTSGNHDSTSLTTQNAKHSGQSCWDIIVSTYGTKGLPTSISYPSPSTYAPPYAPPALPPDIDFFEMAQNRRVVLVLDRSGSMATGGSIEGVRAGAEYWMQNLANLPNEEIGVVTYHSAATATMPRTTVSSLSATQLDGWITTVKDELVAGGLTSIGDALNTGRDVMVPGPGQVAASQLMILLTDGINTAPPAPTEAILASVAERAMRVFTIGFGDHVNAAQLEAIATETCGEYQAIPTLPDDEANEAAIATALMHVDGISGSGLVAYARDTLGSAGPWRFETTTLVEEGATNARFVITYRQSRPVELQVIGPDGVKIVPGTANAAVVRPADSPFHLVTVTDPTPGVWTLRVVLNREFRSPLQRPAFLLSLLFGSGGHRLWRQFPFDGERRNRWFPFTLLGIVSNRSLTIGVAGANRVYGSDEEVNLEFAASHHVPLSNLSRATLHPLAPDDRQSVPNPGREFNPLSVALVILALLLVIVVVVAWRWDLATALVVVLVVAAVIIAAVLRYLQRLSYRPPIVLEEDPADSGRYRGAVPAKQRGSHEFLAVMESDGIARYARSIHDSDDRDQHRFTTPFVRVRRAQVHVGPLDEDPVPPPTDG